MSLRTNEQNARFHQLVIFHDIDKDEKRALVEQYSNGRVSSSKDLSVIEMSKLINSLEVDKATKTADSRKRMMAKAINIGRELGMVTGEGNKVDYEGFNALAKKMYKVEKCYELSNEQLQNFITGLENIKKNKKI
jgi:hypothetical protein